MYAAANGPPSSTTPSPAASPEGSTSEPDILPESPTESDTPSGILYHYNIKKLTCIDCVHHGMCGTKVFIGMG